MRGPVVNERIEELNRRAADFSLTYRQQFVGEVVEVMVERAGPDGTPHGRCERYFTVWFDHPERLTGRCVRVRIDRVTPQRTHGSLAEVLPLAGRIGIPVVFDVFHHALRPSLGELDVRGAVLAAGETWRDGDGRQEVHFSTQEPGKRAGAHSETLDAAAFARFAAEVGDLDLDCVIEVKDKERSVLRAQGLLAERVRA